MADEATGTGWVTVAYVAERYKVSKMTVYRWAREGRIVAIQTGRSIRVKESSLATMEAASALCKAS